MGVLFRYFVGDWRLFAFYDWEVGIHGTGRADPDIVEWSPADGLSPICDTQLRDQAPALGRWHLNRRWRAGDARLFTLMVDGSAVALGTVQMWRVWRRELGWLINPGMALGPYWTAPDYRGRGFYGRLLLHTVHVLAREGVDRMYVWAATNHVASRKGIERAGFRPRGCVGIRRRFCRLSCRVQMMPELPATVLPPVPKTAGREDDQHDG